MDETGERGVARAAALVMAAFAISRLLGLVRQIVFGAFFGTGPEMDAYVAAARVPEALFLIVAGGALASAFLPLFVQRLTEGRKEAAWRLASAIITWLLVLLLPVSLLAMVVSPWLVRTLLAPALPVAVQARTVDVMRVMLLTPAIFSVSGLVMGILNAHRHFLLPALAPIIYNVGLIVGGIVGGTTQLGAMGPALGMVVGAVGHFGVQLPGLLRYRARYWPTLGWGDPGVRDVGRLLGPRTLGMAAAQINMIVINNLASRQGPGAISALEYAWRIMLLPQGVFAQAVGTAVFPTFSAQAAQGDTEALRRTLNRALGMLVALTIPASVGLVALGEPLVSLAFERGAFDAGSTQAVAAALSFFALGLVGHSALEVLGRAYYALQDTWTPAIAAVIAVVLNGVLGLVFPPLFRTLRLLPLAGLALATAVAALLEMVLLVIWLRRRLGTVEWVGLGRTAGRVLLSASGMALVLALWREWGPQHVLWQAGGGVLLGAATYGPLALLLDVEPVRDALWAGWRRLRHEA